jgi:hypothetical protein
MPDAGIAFPDRFIVGDKTDFMDILFFSGYGQALPLFFCA